MPPIRRTNQDKGSDDTTTERRRPRGNVKPWSDAEIERRSRVTDSDIAIAGNDWRRHADPAFRTMLDATDTGS